MLKSSSLNHLSHHLLLSEWEIGVMDQVVKQSTRVSGVNLNQSGPAQSKPKVARLRSLLCESSGGEGPNCETR